MGKTWFTSVKRELLCEIPLPNFKSSEKSGLFFFLLEVHVRYSVGVR